MKIIPFSLFYFIFPSIWWDVFSLILSFRTAHPWKINFTISFLFILYSLSLLEIWNNWFSVVFFFPLGFHWKSTVLKYFHKENQKGKTSKIIFSRKFLEYQKFCIVLSSFWFRFIFFLLLFFSFSFFFSFLHFLW